MNAPIEFRTASLLESVINAVVTALVPPVAAEVQRLMTTTGAVDSTNEAALQELMRQVTQLNEQVAGINEELTRQITRIDNTVMTEDIDKLITDATGDKVGHYVDKYFEVNGTVKAIDVKGLDDYMNSFVEGYMESEFEITEEDVGTAVEKYIERSIDFEDLVTEVLNNIDLDDKLSFDISDYMTESDADDKYLHFSNLEDNVKEIVGNMSFEVDSTISIS